MSAAPKCVLLTTSVSASKAVGPNTERLKDVLSAHKVAFEEVDGSLEENKELRNRLFEVSGTRGVYPLVFIASGDGYRYVGTWETVQELNESHAEDGGMRTAFREVWPAGPVAAPAPVAARAEEEKAEEPLPANWVKCTTKEGKVYYANKATKESSWVRPLPEGAGAPKIWREMKSRDGRTYYYNTQTGATSWEVQDS